MNVKTPGKMPGFTLIEMIVVIGIIGILAGVLFASFGGATDSARAALCLSNMKGLAQAANACAMRTGNFPLAGSREAVGVVVNEGSGRASAQTRYQPQYGWISWLDEGKYDDGHGNRFATSHRGGGICPFYGTGNLKDDTYAVTNGVLWTYADRNRKIYTCPEHVRYRSRRETLRGINGFF